MSLFLKIFLSFWLAQLIIVGTLFGWTWATQQGPSEQHMRRVVLRALRFRADAAATTYDLKGEDGLRKLWRDSRRRDRDDDDNDLNLPRPSLFRMRPGSDPKNPEWQLLAGPELPPNVQIILQRAHTEPPGVWVAANGVYWGAHEVSTPSGGTYVLVDQLRRRWFNYGPWNEFLRFSWDNVIRLFVVLGTTGIVCYALARHFAAPASRLRFATQKFASGDLAARVGPPSRGGRDELSQLGQDFDRMAERIENLVRSERRLLADISHELRSPLARLNVALDLAESEPIAGSTANHLGRIRREGERLNDLVGQLLTLTRLENLLERGESNLVLQPVDLATLTEEVAEDAQFEAQQQNRSVKWSVPPLGTRRIAGDAELLHRALENVVRNAVKYTAENTTVEINLEYDAAESIARWRIRDHGSGVPQEALDQLFRPFYRVADARDRKSGGVGLGLAIADRSIRLHGGKLFAENAPEGGLLVTISLPVVKKDEG
jgi:two-component system sensor histidine kinase CpxA